ncbi:carboxypeptidase-like regulatory domain-containing protein [Sinomicrobium kalidii]|uniref:carboxypeptidase-like regulatory domain-containing protein n=1 Tax=Sinomicrobium kalidii TaxID=2900738 RepID=UPI001E5CDAB2|nr:carboxypeptidase-like regulatory domain-containing protein [Sinomicrobium kalidii]UGU15071.1 carboxypeptidase-like regulatory domain-containing protein [Sinomicrobium kalidii]
MALLLSCGLSAQEKPVWGSVLNERTGKQVPFAHLILVGEKSGTSTDENGEFRWMSGAQDKKARVKFSCIGFESRTLPLSVLAGARVYLSPVAEELDEVEVYLMKREKHRNLNSFRGKRSIGLGNFSGGAYPSAVAKYYEKPRNFAENSFIERVQVRFFPSREQVNIPARFRLRIMEATPEGKPGKDMLLKNLIVQRIPLRSKTEINLLEHRIRIPDNGFFVAVEHLFIKENAYRETRDIRVNDTIIYNGVTITKYAPVFKGVLEANDEAFDAYYRSTDGWKKMNRLDTSSPVFGNKVPAPAFKVRVTD